ncbi:glycerone kinase domain protein [Mycobacterium xenopi 4042]|uniref:Glycerone kinase domain protein n=1 Tax=Mycobacterium xenopi 4042 TaxID=1299334 RepID=X8DBM1_MYCXE|nr:glycerone kinase domain protein [Mycobacterium xenopi 4042]EUA76481.1 glycerone kinase domain protein [Mycobacterium xenopi 4042]
MALEKTPEQLNVLADAGVVDAGGRGLLVLLDAFSATITGLAPARTVYAPSPRLLSAQAPAKSQRRSSRSCICWVAATPPELMRCGIGLASSVTRWRSRPRHPMRSAATRFMSTPTTPAPPSRPGWCSGRRAGSRSQR